MAEYESKMDASQLAYLERKNKVIGDKINTLFKAEEMKITEQSNKINLEIKQEQAKADVNKQNVLMERQRAVFIAQQAMDAKKFNAMADIRKAEFDMKMLADRQKVVGRTDKDIAETYTKADGMFPGMGNQWSKLTGIMAKLNHSPNQAMIGTTKQNIEARMNAAGLTPIEKHNFMTNIATAFNTGGYVDFSKLSPDRKSVV